MTDYAPEGLIRGTLADLRSLMSNPPALRRGSVQLVNPPNPAAGANLVYQVSASYWERLVAVLATFTASAVAGLRQLTFAYCDGDGSPFNLVSAAPQIQAGESWQVSADLFTASPAVLAPSQNGQGSVTSPAALQTIASVALQAGLYAVNWLVGLGGTTGAGDANNFQLVVGSTVVAVSTNGSGSGTTTQQNAEEVEIPAGGATLAVQAIAAGTVGAVYRANLEASEASPNASFPVLPDIICKSSWQLQLQIAGVQAGDQISGVRILTERYPSNWADGALGLDLEEQLEHVGY